MPVNVVAPMVGTKLARGVAGFTSGLRKERNFLDADNII
jgi:hypothetical protein